jgi:hypothetical protein
MEILNKIQRELKAPKGQFNSFSNFNYRSCEDILEAVKPLLGEAVLVIYDEIVLVGDRYYVKATAEITHNREGVHVSAYAREALDKKGMDSAQITGATSSYARKYALNGLFLIDDTKDADSKDNTEVAKKPFNRVPSDEVPIIQTKSSGTVTMQTICHCGLEGKRVQTKKVSKDGRPVGSWFYGCPKPYADKSKCNFFQWEDRGDDPDWHGQEETEAVRDEFRQAVIDNDPNL